MSEFPTYLALFSNETTSLSYAPVRKRIPTASISPENKTKQTSISNSLPFPTFGTKGVFLGGGSKAVTGSHNAGPAALGAASSARRLREERRPNLDSGTFSGSSGGGVLAGWQMTWHVGGLTGMELITGINRFTLTVKGWRLDAP